MPIQRATVACLAVAVAGGAAAQGTPVFDRAALFKHVESIAQLKSQLETMRRQLDQAQQLYGSLNKLTDMADVASILNNPAIRKALPAEFAEIEGLLKGEGAGLLGQRAERHLEATAGYRSDADDFYAKELARTQKRNAGTLSIGEQMYRAASQRIDGIDALRRKIAGASDAKEIADLQARIQVESAFVQTDMVRMQGLQMIQHAQAQVDEQRKAEDWRRRMDAIKEALR
ncbi:P-type DNA transfer protein VirB5 [Chelatococcus asaccharovorans]|uniref:P-type DNA transfer protein VirB5 n=1 Tax=Chelatococcus asaccharovorans TaxID=28210 RepID=UPI00224C636C|nr:P-type DNA transfer protein VirB5 [Chelatococcus asaccharovorans]CAH1658492.1 P-type DNA transfer protein VirB5 [Chelatococcus asaccharovorans]CAH1688602.1 P-type DNA transfer protein VirB5 [Chelatococcus asaccharovorans]